MCHFDLHSFNIRLLKPHMGLFLWLDPMALER